MDYTLEDFLQTPIDPYKVIALRKVRNETHCTIKEIRGFFNEIEIGSEIIDDHCYKLWVDPRYQLCNEPGSEYRLCAILEKNCTSEQSVFFPVPVQPGELVWSIHVIISTQEKKIYLGDKYIDSLPSVFNMKTFLNDIITSENPLSSIDDQSYYQSLNYVGVKGFSRGSRDIMMNFREYTLDWFS